MYTACLFCHARLGANEVIEHFAVGRRLAFHGANGRLWVICPRCARWNLTPLEERWEAIEECERQFRATKLRYATDHIGLAKLAEGLTLVRVGEPLRPEFAAWRYETIFARRRTRARVLTALGIGAALAVHKGLALAGIGGISTYTVYQAISTFSRPLTTHVPVSETETVALREWQIDQAALRPGHWPRRDWFLWLPIDGVGRLLSGARATRALGIILARVNAKGAGPAAVNHATTLVSATPDTTELCRRIAEKATLRDPERHIRKLEPEQRLALDMAAHEELERQALETELRSLEVAWREAEEIAAIADDLLVADVVRRRFEALTHLPTA